MLQALPLSLGVPSNVATAPEFNQHYISITSHQHMKVKRAHAMHTKAYSTQSCELFTEVLSQMRFKFELQPAQTLQAEGTQGLKDPYAASAYKVRHYRTWHQISDLPNRHAVAINMR